MGGTTFARSRRSFASVAACSANSGRKRDNDGQTASLIMANDVSEVAGPSA
jgi:hypothetical protein